MNSKEIDSKDSGSAGAWEFNVLGAIAQNLTQLKSWDQAVKELVQNADDAQATKISFHVSDHGLTVSNNSNFSHCEVVNEKAASCGLIGKSQNNLCDAHAIKTYSSQNKRENAQATGKFGVGFVSVFLFTDRPEIASGNLRMTFLPEEGRIPAVLVDEFVGGTILSLPWAKDPNSEIRIKLEKTSIQGEQIPGIVDELVLACRRSILFVKHLREIEVVQGRTPQLHLVKRVAVDEIEIRDLLSGELAQWMRIYADESSRIPLEELKLTDINFSIRRTEIEVLIPKEQNKDFEGLIYATLATGQRSHLPMHINADFFPDTSRNSIPFHDKGNENDLAAKWNRAIISQCALLVARSLLAIREEMGVEVVWNILKSTYSLVQGEARELFPDCFRDFWFAVKRVAQTLEIVEEQSGHLAQPPKVNLFVPESENQILALKELAITFQKDTNLRYLQICRELGASDLTQVHLVEAIHSTQRSGKLENLLKNEILRNALYSLVEHCLKTEGYLSEDIQDLQIWTDSKGNLVTFQSLSKLPEKIDGAIALELFPRLHFLPDAMGVFQSIVAEVPFVTGEFLIRILIQSEGTFEFVNSRLFKEKTSEALDYFLTLADCETLSNLAREQLKNLEIWPLSNESLSSLIGATLPGSFVDPIGIGKLLDPDRMGRQTCAILLQSLNVQELSMRVYVLHMLSEFFDEASLTVIQAQKLIRQFIRQQKQFSPDLLNAIKKYPLIPTASGALRTAEECLYPSESLLRLCSPRYFDFILKFWETGSEKSKSDEFDAFFRSIGVPFDEEPSLIFLSWQFIQQDLESRSSELKRIDALAEALLNEAQKLSKPEKLLTRDPRTYDLLWPCGSSCGRWHSANEIVQTRWYESICSSERAHKVGVTFRRKAPEAIFALFGIPEKPSNLMLEAHLQHCIDTGQAPGLKFYELLNSISIDEDDLSRVFVERLISQPLFFDEGKFLTPQDIYTEIPMNLEFLASYVHLIREAPKGLEALWSALGIGRLSDAAVVRYFPKIKSELLDVPDSSVSKSKYLKALSTVGAAYSNGENWPRDFMDEFKRLALVLTISGNWIDPHVAVVADNDDWATCLQNSFGENLVRVEAAAYEFLLSSGASRLTTALQVHEESLSLEGPPTHELTNVFRERSEGIFALLANQIIDSSGGSTLRYESRQEELSTIHRLSIYEVGSIDVRVSLRVGEALLTSDISFAPPLYLRAANAVIFAKTDREPWLAIFAALLFRFVPSLGSDAILDSATKFLLVTKEPAAGLLQWLQKNGYLKNEIYLPERSKLVEKVIDVGDSIFLSPDPEDDEFKDDEMWDLVAEYGRSEEYEGMVARHRIEDSLNQEGGGGASGDMRLDPTQSSAKKFPPPFAATDALDKVLSRPKKEDQNLAPSIAVPTVKKTTNPHLAPAKRRISGFAHVEAEKGDGLAHLRNLEVDRAGIEWVIKKEWEVRRRIVDMNLVVHNHKGFDLKSISESDEEDIRFVEVKSCSGDWPDLGVGLTRAQFEVSIKEGVNSWLYVVENALGPDHFKRLHRIHNPWANIRTLYFDTGWREIAEVSPQQNPVAITSGMRVRHSIFGFGWISLEPRHQGQNIQICVIFDDNSERTWIPWDENLISIVSGDDELT